MTLDAFSWRDFVARPFRALFSIFSSTKTGGATNRVSSLLLAILIFATCGTAIAGSYPASYVFQNNVWTVFGSRFLGGEGAVCSTHAAYFSTSFPYSVCQNVSAGGYDVAFKTDLAPTTPITINHYDITRVYYCSGLNDVLHEDLTCTPPTTIFDE